MSDEILTTLRELVGSIKAVPLADTPVEEALELDSIARITLIAEMENEFDIVIDTETMEPEVFENLATLQAFIVGVVD
jgi:acyl carrier protein